jgi:hypothetical protein
MRLGLLRLTVQSPFARVNDGFSPALKSAHSSRKPKSYDPLPYRLPEGAP